MVLIHHDSFEQAQARLEQEEEDAIDQIIENFEDLKHVEKQLSKQLDIYHQAFNSCLKGLYQNP